MILRADPGQLRPRLRAQGQEPHNLNVWDRLEPLSVLIAWICTILLFSARGRAKPIANAAPDPKAARNARHEFLLLDLEHEARSTVVRREPSGDLGGLCGDGKTFVYDALSSETGDVNVFQMAVDGSGKKKLTRMYMQVGW